MAVEREVRYLVTSIDPDVFRSPSLEIVQGYFMTPDNGAALGQRGDVIYGNWMNYGVAIDNDITIDRSDHFAFDTGLITFRMHSYIGGQALGPDAFSVLADEATASSSSSSSGSSSSSS